MKKYYYIELIIVILCSSSCRRFDNTNDSDARLLVSSTNSPDFLLSLSALRGRDIWLKSVLFKFDPRTRPSDFDLDFIDILSTVNRDSRFKKWGLINDPDCLSGNIKSFGWDVCPGDAGPEGLWANLGKNTYRDPACDMNEVDITALEKVKRGDPCTLAFGTSTGIMGLRKFPNPKFKKGATDTSPYLVGMSCGFCHTGYKQVEAPVKFKSVRYDQIHGLAGNQYLTLPGWPSAKQPIYKGQMSKKQFGESLESFGKSQSSKLTRFEDIREYIESFRLESLAQVVGMSNKELINTADIGGNDQWQKGKKIYQSSCKSCHNSVQDIVVSHSVLKSDICESVLKKHLKFKVSAKIHTPHLKSIWSQALFLTNDSIGKSYCSEASQTGCNQKELTVNARIERFEYAMSQLLSPQSRILHSIESTKTLEVQTKLGLLILPKGLPQELTETLEIKKYAEFLERIGDGSESKLTFQQKRSLFQAKILRYSKDRAFLLKELRGYSRCQDVYEAGHLFGSELDKTQKLALISYLKTI